MMSSFLSSTPSKIMHFIPCSTSISIEATTYLRLQITLLLVMALICCRFLELPFATFHMHMEFSLSFICTTLETNEYLKHINNTLEHY